MIELDVHIKPELGIPCKQDQRLRQVTALSSSVEQTPYCKAETEPSRRTGLSLHTGGSARTLQ